MKIKDEKFSRLYHSLIILKSKQHALKQKKILERNFDKDTMLDSIKNKIPSKNKINSLLLYPYIELNRHMSFLVLATSSINKGNVKIYNRNDFRIYNRYSVKKKRTT